MKKEFWHRVIFQNTDCGTLQVHVKVRCSLSVALCSCTNPLCVQQRLCRKLKRLTHLTTFAPSPSFSHSRCTRLAYSPGDSCKGMENSRSISPAGSSFPPPVGGPPLLPSPSPLPFFQIVLDIGYILDRVVSVPRLVPVFNYCTPRRKGDRKQSTCASGIASGTLYLSLYVSSCLPHRSMSSLSTALFS